MSLRSAARPLLCDSFFTSPFYTLRASQSFHASRKTVTQTFTQTKQRHLHTCTPSSALFSITPARHAPRLLPSRSHLNFTPRRHDSSAAQTAPATSTNTNPSNASATTTTTTTSLTWNDFFRLRQRRRFLNVGSSLLTSVLSLGSGLGIIAAQDLESLQIFGLDPLIASALVCIGFMAGGWLAGPFLGTMLFRLFVGRSREMGAKERDFYARIKRYRIDPSSSSMQNPVPDFYGEKITSVAGYRQWLKDQKAFNRKRESFL